MLSDYRANREIQLKQVHFYWICREYVAFEWFRDLLKEIEVEAKQRLVDMKTTPLISNFFFLKQNRGFDLKINIFFTGALKQDKLKEVLTNVNSDLDPITHLESRTNYGRPSWDTIFSDIRERHSGSGYILLLHQFN